MSKYIAAIIPARSGSKSIKDKNILKLCSHPLLAYSIVLAKSVKLINRTFVSTNCENYSAISKKYGAEVPFLRPIEISKDHSTDKEFFEHFLDWAESHDNVPELIVHLRPTTPLRNKSFVESAIKFMIDNDEYSSLRSVSKTHLTPYKMFKKENDLMVPFLSHTEKEFYNLPRQAFEDAYIPNGYVDIVRSETIVKDKMLHGKRTKLWETPQVPDIDVESDFRDAKKFINNSEFNELLQNLDSLKIKV